MTRTKAAPDFYQIYLTRGGGGKIKFAQMLSAVYPGIGPHRNGAGTVSGLYLLR